MQYSFNERAPDLKQKLNAGKLSVSEWTVSFPAEHIRWMSWKNCKFINGFIGNCSCKHPGTYRLKCLSNSISIVDWKRNLNNCYFSYIIDSIVSMVDFNTILIRGFLSLKLLYYEWVWTYFLYLKACQPS